MNIYNIIPLITTPLTLVALLLILTKKIELTKGRIVVVTLVLIASATYLVVQFWNYKERTQARNQAAEVRYAGTVRGETGAGLSGVEVNIPGVQRTTTDKNGDFLLTIPRHRAKTNEKITLFLEGYKHESLPIDVTDGKNVEFTLQKLSQPPPERPSLQELKEQERIKEERRKKLIPYRETGLRSLKLKWYGSNRGGEFNDEIPPGARIVSIGIRESDRVHAIWLNYELNGKVLSTQVQGGSGGKQRIEAIGVDEWITQSGVDGRGTVEILRISTNQRRLVFGTQGKIPVSRLDVDPLGNDAKSTHRGPVVAVGIRGRSDQGGLHALGLIVQYKDP